MKIQNSFKLIKKFAYLNNDIKNWKIFLLNKNKDDFLKEIVNNVFEVLSTKYYNPKKKYELIADTLFQEKIRISSSRWKTDPNDEKEFWNIIKNSLIKIKKNKNWENEESESLNTIIIDILYRYTSEIIGNFNPKIFKIVNFIFDFLFKFILKTNSKNIYEKFVINGDFEKIRNLSKIGNLIIVPTHSSNLDSPIIGWALNSIGLEAVTYGAGINLFSTQPFSFFMNNLGAYKLDRRKKNLIYLELIKIYSKLVIQQNVPSLFYPGGTRSRSGSIEQKLKLGLLGTTIDAQEYFLKSNSNKIFILPVNINYHFVFEANSLINNHLREIGKEKFVSENYEYSTTYKIFNFLFQVLKKKTEFFVTFDDPIDFIGNPLDHNGNSLTPNNRILDIEGYFKINNEYVSDEQRNSEYTKLLGNKILRCFKKNNLILSSNFCAFIYFQMITNNHKNLNLFEIMLLPNDERIIQSSDFIIKANMFKEFIIKKHSLNLIKVSDYILNNDINQILKDAIYHINFCSSKKVLFKDSEGNINTEDLKLVFFYQNKLGGYNFEEEFTKNYSIFS